MIAMRTTSVILVLVAGFAFGTVLTVSYLYTTSSAAEPLSYTQIINDITPQEAYSLIQKNRNNRHLAIFDLRTPAEFRDGYIEGDLNIDYHAPTFNGELQGLDKTKVYLLYCRTARRSRAALEMMKELGFQEVYHTLRGIVRWQADGLLTTK